MESFYWCKLNDALREICAGFSFHVFRFWHFSWNNETKMAEKFKPVARKKCSSLKKFVWKLLLLCQLETMSNFQQNYVKKLLLKRDKRKKPVLLNVLKPMNESFHSFRYFSCHLLMWDNESIFLSFFSPTISTLCEWLNK